MQIELSTSDIDTLRKLQRNLAGSSDYARVTCILMLGMGTPPSFVAECLGIDSSTVYRYRSAFLHGGVGKLLENRHKGYWGLPDSRQLSALRKELKKHVYTDAKSVSDWIHQSFGVRYTVQGTVNLLNRIGFTYKRTAEVSCEADVSRQEEFMTDVIAHDCDSVKTITVNLTEKGIIERKNGKRNVFWEIKTNDLND